MTSYNFGRRSLLTVGTIGILAPALRLFPTSATALAGRAVWVSALISIPFLLLYVLFLSSFMDARQDGENLQELTLRVLGKGLGYAALVVMSLWFLLYAGFVLRSGAERLIVTVYTNAQPEGFAVAMGLLALYAALGSSRTLVRAARLVQPFILGAVLLILFFAFFSVKTSNLLPITTADALPALKGSVAAIDIIAVGAYSLCFIEGSTPKAPGRFKTFAIWLICMALLLMLLSAAVVGCFGAELSAMLTRPFFVLVRNLVFFRTVERVEALVVMLWIFPDFLLVSLFLFLAQHTIRLILGRSPYYGGERCWDLINGRYVIWLCGLAVILCALFIAPDADALELWSLTLIPAINLGFAFVFLPVIYLIAKLKKTI